jgi:hypothetical protein
MADAPACSSSGASASSLLTGYSAVGHRDILRRRRSSVASGGTVEVDLHPIVGEGDAFDPRRHQSLQLLRRNLISQPFRKS